MAFQAAYFGLYGRIECTYEPAMTKAFLHGRTEAIRTVQKESVEFTKVWSLVPKRTLNVPGSTAQALFTVHTASWSFTTEMVTVCDLPGLSSKSKKLTHAKETTSRNVTYAIETFENPARKVFGVTVEETLSVR